MRGYVVVVEGDDESGDSSYAPDLPGVIAAAATKAETLALRRRPRRRGGSRPVSSPAAVSCL
jgi:hypothetical protein